MSRWTAEEITREAARLIQARVGQQYQTTQLREWLQQEWETLWGEHDWRETLRVDSQVVKSGAQTLVLPSKYVKLAGTYNNGENGYGWPTWAAQDYATKQLTDLWNGGTSNGWKQEAQGAFNATSMGDSAVLLQPATPEKLQIASTNSNDKSLYMRIHGETSGGEFTYDLIATDASDGTTAKTTGSTFARVTMISTGAVGAGGKAGQFVVTGKDSGKEYARLDPWEAQSLYASYQLAGVPSVDTTIYYVAKLRWRPFLDAIEAPVIDDVSMALAYGVCSRAMLEKRNPELAVAFGSMREAEIAQAKRNASNKQPPRMVLRRW